MAATTKRLKKSRTRLPGRPAAIEGEAMVVAGEMLRSATLPSAKGVYFLPTDDIILKRGWQTYRDMRHDDQVKAVLAFKKVLVGGRNYEIKPALDGDRKRMEQEKKKAEQEKKVEEAQAIAPPPAEMAEDGNEVAPNADIEKAQEIARFVEKNLKMFNFKRVIRSALTAFEFGFSVGELVWEVREFEGERRVMLKDIKHRDPQSIEIRQDQHGNVLGFRQTSIGEVKEVDPSEVWYWVHQSEFGNAYGISDLRAAYRSWWAKKFIINFWNVFLERMGQPMTLMKYPQGASAELKAILKSILTNLSMKSEVLVPAGVEVELVEATRSGTAKYEEALAFHDRSIARALLMVGLIGLSSENQQGVDSKSRLHLRMLFKMADDLAQDLSYTFMEQVIKPLVDMNFDHGGELYPEFVWQDYGAFEGIEVADAVRQLHAAGVLDLDQNDVNYVRSIIGMAMRGEDDPKDEVQRPAQGLPPPGNAAKPPPAAPQNNERAEKGASSKTSDNEEE